jgi:hypothetical protein
MADVGKQQAFLRAVEAYLADEEDQARRRRRPGTRPIGPRPIAYDESGYPLPNSRPRFAKRVARLLNP